MKNLTRTLKMIFIGSIAFVFIQCGQDDKPQQKTTSEENLSEPENSFAPPESKLTNLIVLIVNTNDLAKDVSQLDSKSYNANCKFAGQGEKENLKEFTTLVRKKSRVIWVGEPEDTTSTDRIIIDKIIHKENDVVLVMENNEIPGTNGLATAWVKKDVRLGKTQSYTIEFTVIYGDGTKISGYTIDPKLRVIR